MGDSAMDSAFLMPIQAGGEGVLPQRCAADGQPLEYADPAILAITDFTREQPITVDEEGQIDSALDDMIRFGVRALLVLRERRIVGLITSYDIQGERPLQFLQNSTYEHHQDVRVGHIMTPWEDLPALDWEGIQTARAGDLLEALRHAGLTHLLVIEKAPNQKTIVRALVSRARLERQLRAFAPAAAAASFKARDAREPENTEARRR